MKPAQLILELEAELTKMGIRVRREKGNFKGGWCVVNEEECLMINKRQSAEIQFSVLAEAIRSLPLDSVYIKPNLRSALEDQWARQPQNPISESDD
ncbi:MAG: hypothetical protein ACC655_09135 [Rhodothermia bacterium]